MSGNRNAKTWNVKELDLVISRKVGADLCSAVIESKFKPPSVANEKRGYERQVEELRQFDWPDLAFCVPVLSGEYFSAGFKLSVEDSFRYHPLFVIDRAVDSLFIVPEGDPYKLASLDTLISSHQATAIASQLASHAKKCAIDCVKGVQFTREVFEVVLKSYRGFIDDAERMALEKYCSMHRSRAEKIMVEGAEDYFKRSFLGLLRSRMTYEAAQKMNWNY